MTILELPQDRQGAAAQEAGRAEPRSDLGESRALCGIESRLMVRVDVRRHARLQDLHLLGMLRGRLLQLVHDAER